MAVNFKFSCYYHLLTNVCFKNSECEATFEILQEIPEVLIISHSGDEKSGLECWQVVGGVLGVKRVPHWHLF